MIFLYHFFLSYDILIITCSKVKLGLYILISGGVLVEIKKGNSNRIHSIDVFRGIIITFMLIGENYGNIDHVPYALRHAEWNELTLVDIIFPCFIFIAGLVIPIALSRRLKRGDSKLSLILHIILRSLAIFIIGVLLNGFPIFDFSTIRIMGVLQRIAVVYLFSSILFIADFGLLVEAIIAISILIIYVLLMKLVPVPGFGPGVLSQNGNLVQYIDQVILKKHMYMPQWDPEGILSTLPAITTGLMGMMAGRVIYLFDEGKWVKAAFLSGAGAVSVILGLIFTIWMPINKNLWSSSFVLVTGGFALLLLAVCYIIVDILNFQNLLGPLKVLGRSAIFVYIWSRIIDKTLWSTIIISKNEGTRATLNYWLCKNMITPWAGNKLDSIYFSITYVLIWVIILNLREHIKIKS